MEQYNLLVVDNDKAQWKDCAENDKAKFPHGEVFFAFRGRDAQEFLLNPYLSFNGIFLNPRMAEPLGLPFIKNCHEHRPQVPLFFIMPDKSAYPLEEEWPYLGVQKMIERPQKSEELFEMLKPLAQKVQASREQKKAASPQENFSLSDDAFKPIAAKLFISGLKSTFDLFIRIKEGHYLKILKAGDNFDQERTFTYLQKGLEHFYILRQEQETYIKYCENLAFKLLHNPKVPTNVVLNQVLNQGEQTLQFLKDRGVDKESIVYAEQFTKNVYLLSQKIAPLSNHPHYKKLILDLIAMEHACAITLMSSLVARDLGFDTPKGVDVVGLAAFLHDIGKYQICPDLHNEHEIKMSAAELARYRFHPEEGGRILRQIGRIISPAVIQAVEQHHERRDKSGFPKGAGGAKVHIVAEIIGICDEFQNTLELSTLLPRFDPFKEFEGIIHKKFQSVVGESFTRLFLHPLSK